MLEPLRSRVLRVAQACYHSDLMVSTAGNFSARDPETGLIAITPSNFPYDTMKVEDIVVVDADEKVVEGEHKPSVDTDIHCFVYRRRDDVHGIVHTHSPYANAFGAVGKPILPVLGTVQALVGGEVPVTPFLHFGTPEAQETMLKALENRRAVVLGGHGITCVSRTIEFSHMIANFVEEGARVYFLALQIGDPKRVPTDVKRT
ncbi:MAG: class II aldolase/adducin family protein [Chloroflexi bacterium]|nr:class II aldolase/adducin family protein [Chloroflexota bacterium]MCH8282975.1 class II aldolase/adducin family protein [Chloroflexota bacterium]